MRNLKRALSLALASVMLLGMMVVGTGAASYTDVSSKHNEEAIAVMQAVGVMVGDTNGKFNPDQKVTRGEMAVVMANLLNLKVNDFVNAKLPFTDVPEWAKAYVAACYADGITAGISATQFGFNYEVTAAQAGLMMMKALGYFQFAPDFGSDWQLATIKQASYINLYKGISAGATSALTRNEVAQLALNTLKSNMVYYSGSQGTNIKLPDGSSIVTGYTIQYFPRTVNAEGGNNYAGSNATDDGYGYLQLCENLYGTDLKKDSALNSDAFGRPGYTWTYKSNKNVVFADKDPVATFTAKTKAADVAKALNGYSVTYTDVSASNALVTAKVNNTTNMTAADKLAGIKFANSSTGTDLVFDTETIAKAIADETANGKLVEIYANSNNVITNIVEVTYTVKEVTNVSTTKDKTTYTIGGTGYVDYVDANEDDTIVLKGAVSKGDYVTYVVVGGKAYVYPTTSVTGTQTSKTNDGKVTISGTEYTVGSGVTGVATFNNSDKSAVYYIDQYGYVVQTTSTAASTDYTFVIDVNGKLSTTIDGTTPSVEARVLLADGTVSVYNVALEKIKTGDSRIGTNSIAVNDYVVKGTTIRIFDAASDTLSSQITTKATAGLKNKTFGYTINDSEIKLEVLTVLPADRTPTSNDTVYATTLTGNVTKDTTKYTANTDKTVLADKNTKFVVYNQDKKTATVYTGTSSLPSTATGTGYAVLKTDTTSNVGTASVVFVSTASGFTADATKDYVYIDATKWTETLVDGSTKYIYTGTKADGSTITLAPGDKIGTGVAANSGLFTYDKDNKVNTTALADTTNTTLTNTFYIYDATLEVTGGLVGVGTNYYNITDSTKIVYIDSNLTEVNGNGGFVVLAEKDGAATSDVAAIFITVD